MNRQELSIDNCIWLSGQTALVEGAIELPSGLPEVQNVLDISALAESQHVELMEGRAVISGVVNFIILYLDKMGDLTSFDARCDFKHALDADGALPGMNALSRARVGEVSCQPQGSRSAAMRCEVKLDLFAWQSARAEVLDPDALDDGLEARVKQRKLSRLLSGRSVKSFVRNDLRIPQSMPPAQKILLSKGYISLTSATPEEGKIALEGELRVLLVYLSQDSNAPLQCFAETLPFGEIVSEDSARSSSQVFAEVTLERMDVELMSSESDTASVSAVIGINSYCYDVAETKLITDMYSSDMECALTTEKLHSAHNRRLDAQKKILRQTLEVPDSFPEVRRVVYASSRADVSGAAPIQDGVRISGTLYYNLIIATADFGFKGLKLSAPFETELSVAGAEEGSCLSVDASCEYAAIDGAGRELEAKVCLDMSINERENEVIPAISGVTLTPSDREHKSGIVVYYADGEHTLWDIAKQFRVRGGRLGGDADEIAQKGTRITLVR